MSMIQFKDVTFAYGSVGDGTGNDSGNGGDAGVPTTSGVSHLDLIVEPGQTCCCAAIRDAAKPR